MSDHIEQLAASALADLPPNGAITISYTSGYGWSAWVRGNERSAVRHYCPTADQAVSLALSEVLSHASAAD